MNDPRLSRYLPRNYSPPQSTSETEKQTKDGDPVCFAPDADRAVRTIQVQWLKARLKSGPVSKRLLLRNVIIENSSDPDEELDLSSLTFTQPVVIVDSEFKVPLNLSLTTFERAVVFNGSRFSKPVNFNGAHAMGTFDMTGANVVDGSFNDLIVDNDFEANGAQFGSVSFKRATFGRCVLFNPKEIEGRWKRVTFNKPVDFSDCSMTGPAEFQGVWFKQSADFTRLQVKKVLKFNCYPEEQKPFLATDRRIKRTYFGGKATFLAANISDSARFMGVCFQGSVDFERAIIGGNALFRSVEQQGRFLVTEFKKNVRFLMTHVQLNAEFDGAKFKGTATFERCRIDNGAFFRASICEERSNNARNGNPDDAVHCLHRPEAVHFEKEANFIGAKIGGDAEFTGAHFSDRARFRGLCVGGIAYFDDSMYETIKTDPVTFDTSVTFSGADIGIRAFFTGARFVENPALIQPGNPANPVTTQAAVDFSLIKIGGMTDFERAYFGADTDFDLAQIGGTVVFKHAQFMQRATFRDARFGSLEFGSMEIPKESWTHWLIRMTRTRLDAALRWVGLRSGAPPPPVNQVQEIQFQGGADLDGFSYSLTNQDDGKVLLDALKTSKGRQPYFFLERSLRSTGNDEIADEVYLQLRNNESKRILPETREHFRKLRIWQGFIGLGRKFLDTSWWLIANYGVRPLQLLFLSILMVALGVWVFSRPGAVVPKEKPKEAMPYLIVSRSRADGSTVVKEVINKPTPTPSQTSISFTQAVGVSFGQFIPIVEIPSGDKWKPSENAMWASFPRISYAAYGTIHRLAGALLLPLGIASLTGFLHRREKPGR
jgi:hypothetical protein